MSRILVIGFIIFPFFALLFGLPASLELDEVFANTVFYVMSVAFLNVWLGLGTAWWLIFTESRWRTFIEWLVFIPLFIPLMASMFGMYIVLANVGLIGTYVGVLLVLLVSTLPYSIRLAYNAMYVIGRPLLEQTKTFPPVPRFAMALFPLLSATIRTIVLFSTVIVLGQFILVQLIGAGLTPTVTTQLYQSYAGNDVSLALRNTWILLLLPIIFYIGLGGLFNVWVRMVKERLR